MDDVTIDVVLHAFHKLKMPTSVRGDEYGTEASASEIIQMLASDPQDLKIWHFRRYLGYRTTGGMDDFMFLLPAMLRIWQECMYEKSRLSQRGDAHWFVIEFHKALATTNVLYSALDEELRDVVIKFMRTTLLNVVGRHTALPVAGESDFPSWFGPFVSYGVITSDIPRLWATMWDGSTDNHRIALVQFSSCLICGSDDNPVFQLSSNSGVRIEALLWTSESSGNGETWRPDNTSFLGSVLSVEYLIDRIEKAYLHLGRKSASNIGRLLLDRASTDAEVIDERCRILPSLLSTPDVGEIGWGDIGLS